MSRILLNIAILEPSSIIKEGIENLILRFCRNINIIPISSVEETLETSNAKKVDLFIIDPILIINKGKVFNNLKHRFSNSKFIALINGNFDRDLTLLFDDYLNIYDSREQLIKKIESVRDNLDNPATKSEELSEREREILKEIVGGLTNKEIADKLFISIHTVISHRKNIVQKTKIKSQAGLTVYAITNNIVSIDQL